MDGLREINNKLQQAYTMCPFIIFLSRFPCSLRFQNHAKKLRSAFQMKTYNKGDKNIRHGEKRCMIINC